MKKSEKEEKQEKTLSFDTKDIIITLLTGVIIALVIVLIVFSFAKGTKNELYSDNDVNDKIDNKDTNTISKQDALNIALQDAGLNENDVYDIDIELDYKYNTKVYEIDFDYHDYEYEYYINTETGEIVKSFKERDR